MWQSELIIETAALIAFWKSLREPNREMSFVDTNFFAREPSCWLEQFGQQVLKANRLYCGQQHWIHLWYKKPEFLAL